jgi:lactoylglutathione lyase/glyoxylase I family protein
MASIQVKQLAHVCFYAHNVEATADWYKKVLGLDIQFKFNRKGQYFGFYLNAGGRTHVECFHNPDAVYEGKNALTHFCLEVESIDDAIAHIRSVGVEATDKFRAADETYQSWITDPNGVRIELFEYTPQSHQFAGGDVEAHW